MSKTQILLTDPLVLDYTKNHINAVSTNVFASPLSLPYSDNKIHELLSTYTRKREEVQLIHQRSRRVPQQLESEIQNLDFRLQRLFTKMGIPLFQKIDDTQILDIVRRMKFVTCRQGDVLWDVRQSVHFAALLITANFEAIADVHGHMVPIAEFRTGRTVGDIFLVDKNAVSDYKLVCTKSGIYGVLTPALVGLCGHSSAQKEIDTHAVMNSLKTIDAFKHVHPVIFKEVCKSARLVTLSSGELLTADLVGSERTDLSLSEACVLYVAKGAVEIMARVRIANKNIKTSLIPLFTIAAGEFFGHADIIFTRGIFWFKLREYLKIEANAQLEISSVQARAVGDLHNTKADSGRDTLVVLFKGVSFDSLVNYPQKLVAAALIPKIDEYLLKYAEKLKALVQSLSERKKLVSIDDDGNIVTV